MHFRIKLFVLLAALPLAAPCRMASAQAIPTASKGADVDAFFMFTYTDPDYGRERNKGFTAGGDFMLKPHKWGQPGFNVRYSRNPGKTVNESFFGGGLDLRMRTYYSLFRPYFAVDYGVGSIKYNPTRGIDDSGNQLMLAGGVDVPIKWGLAARGEFNYNHLKIAGGRGPDLTFNPFSASFGVVYKIR